MKHLSSQFCHLENVPDPHHSQEIHDWKNYTHRQLITPEQTASPFLWLTQLDQANFILFIFSLQYLVQLDMKTQKFPIKAKKKLIEIHENSKMFSSYDDRDGHKITFIFFKSSKQIDFFPPQM